MQQKYDFILFENLQGAINHYKDVCIIAHMLQDAGYSVAIATLYDEEKYCTDSNISLLQIEHKIKRPNNDWQFNPKNKLHSLFCTIRYIYQQHIYLKEFLNNIKGLAKNYYVGSYHTLVSSLLINEATNESNVFFWGLRSYRIFNTAAVLKNNVICGLKNLYLKPQIIQNNHLKFFVSNEIIRNEFLAKGIIGKRLILREERTCTTIPVSNINLKTQYFSILAIGLLRESKRIVELIQAFKQVASKEDRFFIAGRTSPKYGELIRRAIDNDERIVRIDGYIEESEYQKLFEKCHYLILGDKEDVSSVTNGTMLEAFIHRRPIIAPNYNPYKYYIEKYDLGFLYNPNNMVDFNNLYTKAKDINMNSYEDSFNIFLGSIEYSNFLLRFKNEIETN